MLGLTLGINLASNIHSIVTQVVTSLMLGCQVFLKKCFHVPLSSRNTFIDKVCACGTGARTFHFASTQPPRRKQLYTLTYQLYPETRQLQPALAQLFSCAYQLYTPENGHRFLKSAHRLLYTPENGHRFLKSAHRFPIATAIPSPTTLCQYVEGGSGRSVEATDRPSSPRKPDSHSFSGHSVERGGILSQKPKQRPRPPATPTIQKTTR